MASKNNRNLELALKVRRFFEILDTREWSDNAQKYFHPVKMDFTEAQITSIRVMRTIELNKLLPEMKKLAKEQVLYYGYGGEEDGSPSGSGLCDF